MKFWVVTALGSGIRWLPISQEERHSLIHYTITSTWTKKKNNRQDGTILLLLCIQNFLVSNVKIPHLYTNMNMYMYPLGSPPI